MPQREDEGAFQRFAHARGRQHHRQHEEAMVRAGGDNVLQPFAEEAGQREMDLADLEEPFLSGRHRHQDLRVHTATKVGDDRAQLSGIAHLNEARLLGNLGA